MEKLNIDEKILLVLLPFWPPLIPPLGITSLKTFLQQHGYRVTCEDANVKSQLGELYHRYFDTLKAFIPEEKAGNFHNIGHEVWENHAMAHLHAEDEKKYMELIKLVIHKTFYTEITDPQVRELIDILNIFYERLEAYITDLLARKKPAVLGLSIYSGTLPASLFMLRWTRQNYPHIKTVIGGGIFTDSLSPSSPNIDFFLERTAYIDKIIMGEGELLFLKYLQGEFPDSQKIVTLSDINKETLEISRVEVPDFSDFDLTHYPYLAAGTSRSCPFQCKFCAETVNWGTYRKKKSTQVVQELMTLNQQHGTQLFLMCDSLLNPVINPLADELLNWEPVVYWDGYLRVDRPVIDVDTAWRWRRAGFYRARLGVESGSQNVLDRMNKKITVEQIANALTNLARVGIKTTAMWVIGFPGETEADFQQTLDLLEQFKDDIYEADCNPFVYHPAGQVNSREWNQENKKKLLYPRDAREMLLLQTWYWDESPSRQETYERLNRLVQHCKRLGIPNPYSLFDIYNADDRWERLHENAVPSLVTFKNKEGYIDECRGVKKLSLLHKKIQSNVDFAF